VLALRRHLLQLLLCRRDRIRLETHSGREEHDPAQQQRHQTHDESA